MYICTYVYIIDLSLSLYIYIYIYIACACACAYKCVFFSLALQGASNEPEASCFVLLVLSCF